MGAESVPVAPSLKQLFADWIDRRTTVGVVKYSGPLTTFNGRDPGLDALEEILDFCQYQHQRLLETEADLLALALLLTKIKQRAKIEQHTHSDVANCMWDPFACDITDTMHSALDRPGVRRLLAAAETPENRGYLMSKIRCRLCGDVIENRARHDLVWCRCGEVFEDGGPHYLRTGARTSLDNIEVLVQPPSVGGSWSKDG